MNPLQKLAAWKNNNLKRFWARDASLWTNTDEAQWMGWLNIVEMAEENPGKCFAGSAPP